MTASRRPWTDLPGSLVVEVERVLGGPVATFDPVSGGFSNGVVGIFTSRSGSQVFVKAVPSDNPAAADYRIESRVADVLPTSMPTPRLLLFVDGQGWVLLGFEAVIGRTPREPWLEDELHGALDALTAIASSPATSVALVVPTVAQRLSERCTTWRNLVDQGYSGELQLSQLGSWEQAHLQHLAEIEDGWGVGTEGEALLHFDLRYDNFIVDTTGRTVVLDWGRASRGQPWVDLVCLLLESDLGPLDPERIFTQHPLGRTAQHDAVNGLLVALGSYWTRAAATPQSPSTAALRLRQEDSRQATMRWLQRRWA